MKTFSSYTPLSAVGFPSPAEDQTQRPLDLHDEVVTHPTATFFLRASGNNLQEHGIYDKDLLVIDRAQLAQRNDLVIAVIEDELTVIPFHTLSIDNSPQIWGVVTHIIHYARRRRLQ